MVSEHSNLTGEQWAERLVVLGNGWELAFLSIPAVVHTAPFGIYHEITGEASCKHQLIVLF